MKGISPFPQSDPEARENWRTTNDVVDELYFQEFLQPGDDASLTGTAVVAVLSASAAVSFPNAGIGSWHRVLHRRARWRAAGLRVTIWYTCAVGSTNNFQLALVVQPHDEGSVFAGLATSLSTTITLPGPAVANTEMVLESVFTTSTIIAGNLDLLAIRFRRDPAAAGDVNTGDLLVTGVLLEVLPQ